MAHMLSVSALQIGYPIGAIVLMEANDFLFHNQRT
jgi:hypothetical protein